MSRSSEFGLANTARRAGCRILLLLTVLSLWGVGLVQTSAMAQSSARPWAEVGRAATPAEIKAWDIDVRADFKGLPPGAGSVAKGQDVWEDKCASCHGVFGESNEVFAPIVGGTTKDDIRSGRVANLQRSDYPFRTTLMKLSQVSTLWDYINRAMPWNAPKSLSVEEVYALVAFILHLGDVLPADFVLSNLNIAEVQSRLPNRLGVVAYRNLWAPGGKPDVQGDACMAGCTTAMDVRSSLPASARNAHGNLAEQNRLIGPARGADTSRPVGALLAAAPDAGKRGAAMRPAAEIARESNCLACHASARKLVGPSFSEIGERYRRDPKAEDALMLRVRQGGQGVWGSVPMPANPQLKDDELRTLVRWILGGAR